MMNFLVAQDAPSDFKAWVCPQLKAGGYSCNKEGKAKAVAFLKSQSWSGGEFVGSHDDFMNFLHAVNKDQQPNGRKMQLFDIGV